MAKFVTHTVIETADEIKVTQKAVREWQQSVLDAALDVESPHGRKLPITRVFVRRDVDGQLANSTKGNLK